MTRKLEENLADNIEKGLEMVSLTAEYLDNNTCVTQSRALLFSRNLPITPHVSPSVGWLFCLSLFPKRSGSYTSMLLLVLYFRLRCPSVRIHVRPM